MLLVNLRFYKFFTTTLNLIQVLLSNRVFRITAINEMKNYFLIMLNFSCRSISKLHKQT